MRPEHATGSSIMATPQQETKFPPTPQVLQHYFHSSTPSYSQNVVDQYNQILLNAAGPTSNSSSQGS